VKIVKLSKKGVPAGHPEEKNGGKSCADKKIATARCVEKRNPRPGKKKNIYLRES